MEIDKKYSSKKYESTIELIMPIERYVCWQASHHAQRLTVENRWDKMEMIEIPSTGESADLRYLIARLEDENKKRREFFDLYCEGKVPLAFLAVNEGGLTGAIGSIVNEERGFIECCSGNVDAMSYQITVGKRMIAGDPFYIDGSSALVLSEAGLLTQIFEHLPGLRVPQSVITFLLETKDRFKAMPGRVGYMRYTREKLSFSNVDEETSEAVRRKFRDCISLLESKPHNITAISNANKADCFSEQRIPPSLCDGCIMAQERSISILTEDYRYLQANQLETGKRSPEYCSSIALMGALYEEGKVTLDQYLEFFYYLTSYRFRFLPVSATDIEKAVLGDGAIRVVRPDRVRLFNFPLTLSEEYGVPFDRAFSVVGHFLVRVLIDDSVMPEMADKIFGEILTAFPTNMEKRSLGRMLIGTCIQVINDMRQTIIVGTRVQEKVDSLSRFNEGFGEGSILLT